MDRNQEHDEENCCGFNNLCRINHNFDEDMNQEDTQKYICKIYTFYVPVSLIISIIIIVTVTMSFWYVSYNQYALIRNTYNGVDLHNVYGQGRYFMTLPNSMVYFPSTYTEVTYTSKTFAENGLEFDCYITFYYKLPKKNVGSIYDSYSTTYDTRVINNAKQITKNIASTFSVNNFLNNRTYIETTMAYALEDYLMSTVMVDAPAEYFKIVNIIFPQTLIDKSLETAIALQNNNIQSYQQQVDVINADTLKLKAEIDAESSRTIEYANNQASQIIVNSQSEASKILAVVRSKGIEQVCNVTGINSQMDINAVTNVFAVMDNSNFTMLNNLKGFIQVNT